MSSPDDIRPEQISDVKTQPGAQSAKVRNALVVVLTFGVGSIDALTFLSLGVFASFMSGNTITLGIGIGGGNLHYALHSLAAILGYLAGVAIGANFGLPESVFAKFVLENQFVRKGSKT